MDGCLLFILAITNCSLPSSPPSRSACPQFGMQWNVTWGRVNRLSELEVSHMGSLQGAGEPAKYC